MYLFERNLFLKFELILSLALIKINLYIVVYIIYNFFLFNDKKERLFSTLFYYILLLLLLFLLIPHQF